MITQPTSDNRAGRSAVLIIAATLIGIVLYAHAQTISSLGSPAGVVSVVGPIPPFNPGGPEVGITLVNVGDVPITSLNATLSFTSSQQTGEDTMPSSFTFIFSGSASNPLLPGQTTQEMRTLIDGGFDSATEYPLTIDGTLANGAGFSYTIDVQVAPPG